MYPPAQHDSKGRVASSCALFSSTELSPSPLAPNLKYVEDENRIDVSSLDNETDTASHTNDGVSINIQSPRLQSEVTQSVDAKADKTTTMPSLSPPHAHQTIFDRLDRKEYPLASKLPPSSLFNFLFEFGQESNSRNGIVLGENTPSQSLKRPPTQSTIKKKGRNIRTRTQPKKNRSRNPELRQVEGASESLSLTVDKIISESKGQSMSTTSNLTGRSKEVTPNDSRTMPTFENESEVCKRLRRRSRRPCTGLQENQLFPITPETFKLKLSIPDASGSRGLCDRQNSQHNKNQSTSLSAVSTPPVAESDLQPFVAQVSNIDQYSTYPATNVWNAQKTSLPSPGLSPIYSPDDSEYHIDAENVPEIPIVKDWNSQGCLNKTNLSDFAATFGFHSLLSRVPDQTFSNMQSMIDTFDSMPTDMKNLMMFQLLRRCSRRTLHVIADTVNPALKCDFLVHLPLELSLHILSFLSHRDLCRSAQVSKQWRNIVDSNETGWREIFDRDGFTLPKGELEKAICQGWGWQDPFGTDGFEQDLSIPILATPVDNPLDDNKLDTKPQAISIPKGGGLTKRKRVVSGSERSKRRAVNHEFAEKAQAILSQYHSTAKFNKSEGPLTAANAAILAVPDPKLGLPGLRRLHLFKSLYRRHYMLQNSWMSGKVAPYHFAFPAHASHVITCLQFDDDKIITGSDDTLINVYDTKTGALRKKLEGHEGGVWALQYENNVLVSGSTDRSVRVWDIEKGLCTQVFHGHTSTVRCLLILLPQITGKTAKGQPISVPEKPLIITGSRDSQLRVWRLPERGSKRYIQTGPPANDTDCPYFIRILSGHAHSVRAISAHQDTLVSGSYDNTVRVWKISTGQTIHRLTGHTMKVYSVVLDHKRDRCISGSMDNFVKIWSIETGACLYTLEGHSSLVGLLDLHDERLVSAAADSTLRIWDPENGQCKSTLSAHTGAITCFQHDGQKVISGSDRTLKLWNIKTGECIKDLLIDLSGVWQVKFDERRCVAAVQRDNLTYVEVLDFGASRDGVPLNKRGSRRLLSDPSERAGGDL
ncbi:putative E3 ubiquitin ligase complex SCF subunit sconB [Golovinomyces cichoracearum]|uniref:Putative E3 ubiquitin ligase complex SCF subunit sconB n=1 Tax=Golovinomyces cichoracearum TaxID=62708 RepID=A0A420I8J8_9PEZI|nr:putative E3 ubiquitin ligase complex SCF subunit sconB [Golovinomyces cichoracearum]